VLYWLSYEATLEQVMGNFKLVDQRCNQNLGVMDSNPIM